MKPTRKHLMGVAAALSAVAIAAPASTASAVVPFPVVAPGWGGFTPWWGGTGAITSPILGPVTGGVAVVGPTIITTAPSSFINTNNQVSAGGNWSGGQAAP